MCAIESPSEAALVSPVVLAALADSDAERHLLHPSGQLREKESKYGRTGGERIDQWNSCLG